MNSNPENLSAVLESALTASDSMELVLAYFEHPTLESKAFLQDQKSLGTLGTPMLSVEAVRSHYENYFRIPDDRPRMITVDELEDQFNHRISVVCDCENDDGWEEYLNDAWGEYIEPEEDITGDRYVSPTAECLQEWKLAVLELMQRRFEMLKAAGSKA